MKMTVWIVAAVFVMSAGAGQAAVTDHLACYKVKDPTKIKAMVNLAEPQIGAANGCTVSGAALFCVAASKTVVRATSNNAPLTPLPYAGPPAETDRLCYKLKCPRPPTPVPGQEATDQFGTRTLTNFTAAMLCTPAVEGAGFCGNGTIDPGEQCDGSNLKGASCLTLGFATGTLACAPGCTYDISGCSACPGTKFPATGQTTCWDDAGAVIPCAGTGHDGDTHTGAPLAYVDNGDGTVTDANTGLMWEKQSNGDGSVHDFNNLYTWDQAFSVHVATLNSTSFAGHTNWRVPNLKELESIVDLENFTPAVSPAFNSNCTSPCTVLTCSCTAAEEYWSSSSDAQYPGNAWGVEFFDGNVAASTKAASVYVRAVRGGS
jgi:hypothetical protein